MGFFENLGNSISDGLEIFLNDPNGPVQGAITRLGDEVIIPAVAELRKSEAGDALLDKIQDGLWEVIDKVEAYELEDCVRDVKSIFGLGAGKA